jgi:uncharacterized protein (UPF0335 family)
MAATSALKISAGTTAENFASDRLKSLIERIERLEQEKSDLAADVRDVYAEAKSSGFEPKVMRQVIRLRKMDGNDRNEQEELLDLYKHALGMI